MFTDLSSASVPPASHAHRRTSDGGFFAHHGMWAPGVRLFRKLRFSAKASIISLAFTIPLLGTLAWQQRLAYEQGLDERMDATRQHVEIAQSLVAWAQSQEVSGQLSRDKAQQLALQELAALRYETKEYFWVNDTQPKMLMHPIKPELNGTDVSELKDPNGLAVFKAVVNEVQQHDKGFVSYQWPKPGHDQPVDKVSYVMGFKPWGWIIGSGVYTDDLRDLALKKAEWTAVIVSGAMAFAAYLF